MSTARQLIERAQRNKNATKTVEGWHTPLQYAVRWAVTNEMIPQTSWAQAETVVRDMAQNADEGPDHFIRILAKQYCRDNNITFPAKWD